MTEAATVARSTRRGGRPARLVAIAFALLLTTSCREPSEPRSVLLVVVDTLRAGHLGIYGHTRATSPHLDERAREAVLFERAFSTSSWTLPAIGSILTGQLPAIHGARSLAPDAEGTDTVVRHGKVFSRLRPEVPTLAALLAERGYRTGAITSNPFLDRRFGLDRGFDSYDQEPRRRARAVTDAALTWLADDDPRPYFLLVHYMDPHLPYRPPPDVQGTFTSGIDSELDYSLEGVRTVREALPTLSAADREFLAAAYDEEILYLDRELERLFATLDEAGSWDDTLVALTSDHGEELFEHGGFEHGHTLYNEVLQVPLVVWDGRAPAGRRRAAVSIVDLAPTVLEAVGHPGRSSMAGDSLWPALAAGEEPPERPLAAHDILHGADQLTILEWPRKVIGWPESGRLELFDLDRDPAERNDLTGADREGARRLLARAEGLLTGGPAVTEIELDAATLSELKALGYVD